MLSRTGLKKLLNSGVLCISAMLFLVFAGACSNRGCTDTDAENFEPKAKTDCNCCYYMAKGLGWYKKPFEDYTQAAGITELRYYANNVLVGGGNPRYAYSVSAPTGLSYLFYNPGDKNVLVVSLGNAKELKMEVRVTDQNDRQVWKDSVIFYANKVIAIELK